MSPTNHCKKRLKEIALEEDNSCESGASSGPHCQTRLPYWPQVSSMLSSAHLHLSLIGLSCPQWVAWEQAGADWNSKVLLPCQRIGNRRRRRGEGRAESKQHRVLAREVLVPTSTLLG